MQTFLPYPDFEKSARCLDRRRLGKQRLEAKQIWLALEGGSVGWKNHPAVLMWTGCENALIQYGIAICNEWITRGYKDTLLPWFLERKSFHDQPTMPFWFGDKEFHAAHRAALLSKDPEWYRGFGWKEQPGVHYLWPVQIC